MEEKLIDSHIQMPKSVLKRFEDKNHRFYYFDVKGGFIGNNGHSGKINTKQGFYSKEAEEFLNKNIEKPFSELFEVIDGISIDPPQGHIDAAFDYIPDESSVGLIYPKNCGTVKLGVKPVKFADK